jgi:lambda family phage portal protein
MRNWLRKQLIKLIVGSYDATKYSPRRTQFHTSCVDAHIDMNSATRSDLVAKVRELERNNGIIQKCADLSEQFVAGAGGMPVIASSSDEEWNKNAQAWWDKWCMMCDIASLQSFGTIQQMLARIAEIDGEAFILKTYGQSGMPRIQILEGHRIQTPPEMHKREGLVPGIIDGVEVNDVGRPVGYYFRQGDGKTATYRRFDAATVIHYFEPSRPGQYRGLTPWHAVINDIIDLDDLQKLEMDVAKEAATIANVLMTESGEMDIDGLRRQLGTVSGVTSSGASTTETRAQYVKDAIGGRSIALRQGEKIEQFRSDRPSVTTQEYWDYLVSKILAGRGISKLLAFPYGKGQGTQIRAELEIAAGFFRCRSMVLADVIRQVWIYVIGTARFKDAKLMLHPEDWENVTILPPRAPNVDVGYNSSADIAEWKAGLKTMRDLCLPRGLDWREVIKQKAIEAKEISRIAADFGVDPILISNPSEATPSPQPNTDLIT